MITVMRHVSMIAVLALAAGGCGSSASTPPRSPGPPAPRLENQSYRVTGVVLAPVSTMSEEEAKASIGKTLEIRDGVLRFNGSECKPMQLSRRSEPADAYAEGFKMTPAQLGLTSATITIVTTGCDGPLAEYVEVDSSLLVAWDGVFYQLQKAP